MNDCPMSSKLTALREGWLEPEEAEDLRRHTAACARCRETAKRLEEAVRLLRHDADPVAPPRMGWEALLEAARDERVTLAFPARRMRTWGIRAAGVAAVLILTIGSIVLLRGGDQTVPPAASGPPPDDLELLLEDHALASDQVPFSDGAYMTVLATSEGRTERPRRDREPK